MTYRRVFLDWRWCWLLLLGVLWIGCRPGERAIGGRRRGEEQQTAARISTGFGRR